MRTKVEIKQKQVKSAINYRKYNINYISAQIQDLLKELRAINDMPDNLVNEKIIKERLEWAKIEEANRELSNNVLGELKI